MVPVFLCGFMGCGKSTVGRIVAKKTERAFVDLDEYIEDAAGISIPEIFERYGESHFRTLEAEAIKIFDQSFTVVALGGGAVINDRSRALANKAGLVIFIDTPFDLCYDRIKDDGHRPIAKSSTKEELKARFDARYPVYLSASSVRVDGSLTPDEIAMKIIEVM